MISPHKSMQLNQLTIQPQDVGTATEQTNSTLTPEIYAAIIEKIISVGRTIVFPNAGKSEGVSHKSDPLNAQPVTPFDVQADVALLQLIREHYPFSYGEESFGEHTGINNSPKWLVDSIDGTLEFIAGKHGSYAVQAALTEERNGIMVPTQGVIFLPNTHQAEELFFTRLDGTLAHYVGNEEVPYRCTSLEKNLRVHVRESTFNKLTAKIQLGEGDDGGDHLPRLFAAYRNLALQLEMNCVVSPGPGGGGSGPAAARLLRGEVDLIVNALGDGAKEWDVAPLIPIIEAAGGWVHDFDATAIAKSRNFGGSNPVMDRGMVASISLPRALVSRLLTPEQL